MSSPSSSVGISEEEDYEGIVLNAEAGICRVSEDLAIQFINPYIVHMLSYRHGDELLGRSLLDVVAPSDQGRVQKEFERRRIGLPGHYRMTLKRKDRSPVSVYVSSTSIQRKGVFLGSFGILRDEPSVAGAGLQADSIAPRLRKMAERLPLPIIILAADLRFLYLNASAKGLFGAGGAPRSSLRKYLDAGAQSRIERIVDETEKGEGQAPFFLDLALPFGESKTLCVMAKLDSANRRPEYALGIVDMSAMFAGMAAEREEILLGYGLTERELDIARLLGGGAAYKDIAKELAISLSTVRTLAQRLYRRMSIHSRAELLGILAGPEGDRLPSTLAKLLGR
jgi:PAS domain S-box-containing protein